MNTTSCQKTCVLRCFVLCIWNCAFNSPFKFFLVCLTYWSNTWQSGLFTRNPPPSSSSSPVNSTISVRSFTFPAPSRTAQTSMPNFPYAAFTHSNKIFYHCLRKIFTRQLLEIWVQILFLQPLQLLGHSLFPIQDGILALLKGSIFSFASAHNVNELHAHFMRLQQMLVAQSQTITWSRW